MAAGKRARYEIPAFFEETIVQNAFRNSLQEIDLKPVNEIKDLRHFLTELAKHCHSKFLQLLQLHKGIKVWIVIEAQYSPLENTEKTLTGYLRTKALVYHNSDELDDDIQKHMKELESKNANFMRDKSGLTMRGLTLAKICVSKHLPLVGRSFQELPYLLLKSKSIINVDNRDERCFGYAILAALHPQKTHGNRHHEYDAYFSERGLDTLNYPVSPEEVPALEAQLQININIFSFYDDEGMGKYPLFVSRQKNPFTVDLLFWNGHYAWIKNFDKFMHSITKNNGRKYICKRCFGHFTSAEVLESHQFLCAREDFSSQIFTLPPAGMTLHFKNIRYQLQLPFVIYADFECLTEPSFAPGQEPTHGTHNYQKHVPCSVGLKLVSRIPELAYMRFEHHTGADAASWFLRQLLSLEDQIKHYLFDYQRLIMTSDDQRVFENAKFCSICGKPFGTEEKVRDHDHYTGRFRGAAHKGCNIQMRKTYKVPIFLHNFRGYDAHIIVMAMSEYPTIEIKVIGQGYEKYLTVSWGDHLVFKDSLQFMACSLEQLAANLKKSGADQFKQLRSQFGDDSEEKKAQLELILRKGVYPYDYMDTWARFDEQRLPPIEGFSSRLRSTKCSDSEYEHAQRVWNAFRCKSLGDYHELYLKTDVLLLADIFESFRNVCLEHYGLDAAHYVSSPQLTWDAMLKFTDCELELISDPEIFRTLDGGMRGGVVMITKRYARANNKFLGLDNYDATKPTTHIIYLDANNLYGWAMSCSLPIDGFLWMKEEEWSKLDWCAQEPEQEKGYIVVCDLAYPEALHDSHNDFPLAVERLNIEYNLLSEHQVKIRRKYRIPKSAMNTKLVPNLLNKINYCCHYQLLRFYLEHGLRLLKVHRVLSFRQAKWIAPYILKNSSLRAAAKNDFEKDFFKLMNNAVYGKTCENQKKRTDIQLVTTEAKRKRLMEKPHCLGFRIFDENLAAVDMRKIKAMIDKPFYVGFSVLELSKLHMLRFHYEFIKKRYGERAQLLFTDTDSLMYEIETENIYKDMWESRDEFDFSGYPKQSAYYDNTNNKVIGKFKDETNGDPILEFVGLRPKMYSFLTISGTSIKEKHRAKGIQFAASKLLTHEDFKKQLERPEENVAVNRRIMAKLHKVFN